MYFVSLFDNIEQATRYARPLSATMSIVLVQNQVQSLTLTSACEPLATLMAASGYAFLAKTHCIRFVLIQYCGECCKHEKCIDANVFDLQYLCAMV